MEIEYLKAHETALTADRRTIEMRRMYHELARADRLKRGLLSARRRGTLGALRPTLDGGKPTAE